MSTFRGTQLARYRICGHKLSNADRNAHTRCATRKPGSVPSAEELQTNTIQSPEDPLHSMEIAKSTNTFSDTTWRLYCDLSSVLASRALLPSRGVRRC